MNVSAIGSNAAQSANATEQNVSSPAAATPEPADTVAPAKDTVKLSQAAQVHLLKQQGQSASQIQSSLGISAAVLNGYLGVSVKVPVVAVPTAAVLKKA